MAEILTSDNSITAEVMESQEADIADSLRVGEELEAAHEQRLAGKYKNTEELEAAYLELQKKLGSDDSNVSEEPEKTDDTAWMAEAREAIKNGKLSREVAEELQGMSGLEVYEALKDQAQTSSQTSRDLSDQDLNSIYSAVGGEDAYGNLIGWAADNFSEAEIAAYDQIVESGNMAQINLALQSLYYRYTDAVGQDGDLLQGKPAAAQSGYRSQAELIQAMNDPRYDDDPAYRQDVLNKLDRSDISF